MTHLDGKDLSKGDGDDPGQPQAPRDADNDGDCFFVITLPSLPVRETVPVRRDQRRWYER